MTVPHITTYFSNTLASEEIKEKKTFHLPQQGATQSPEPGMKKRAPNCSMPKAKPEVKPKACKRLPDEFSSRGMGLFIAL
jgi:hypothetical protein